MVRSVKEFYFRKMGSSVTETSTPSLPDLSKSKYDQETYTGRALHFFRLTNPLNLLTSDASLEEAKQVVDTYKKTGKIPPGYDEEMLWEKKYLVDSAFHPDTGEKMMLIGRMSAQMPMNTLITGGMITFYSTTAQTVFWQWLNQTFNAVVNYTNRSGDAAISKEHLFKSYCAAVGGAVGTALFLNAKAKKAKNPIFMRLVPFAAVCGANFINIPMMRSNELIDGTPVFSENGELIGNSKSAAKTGIVLVCISRCIMALPGMTLTPVITNYGINAGWFRRYPKLINPFQLLMCSFCIGIATPLGCALFKQTATLPASALEPELEELCKEKKIDTVYYNKGL